MSTSSTEPNVQPEFEEDPLRQIAVELHKLNELLETVCLGTGNVNVKIDISPRARDALKLIFVSRK